MVSSILSETQRGIIDTVRVINVFVVQGPLHAVLVGGLNNIRRGQSVHNIARKLDRLEQTWKRRDPDSSLSVSTL